MTYRIAAPLQVCVGKTKQTSYLERQTVIMHVIQIDTSLRTVKVEVFCLFFSICYMCCVSRRQCLSDLYFMLGFGLAFLFAFFEHLSVNLFVYLSFWPVYRICIISAIRVGTIMVYGAILPSPPPPPPPPNIPLYFKMLQKLKSSNVYIFKRETIYFSWLLGQISTAFALSLRTISSNFNILCLSLSYSLAIQLCFIHCYRSLTIYDIFILSTVYYEPRGGVYYLHVLNALL